MAFLLSRIAWLSPAGAAIALLFTLTGSLSAQSAPQAISGLEITPDGGTTRFVQAGQSSSEDFTAHNGLSTSGTWTFTCSKTGGVSCGTVSPASATIAAGANRVLVVNFTGTVAGTARITVTASPGGETGFINITVTAPTIRSVAVTPDNGATVAKPVSTSGYSEVFTVKNTGNVSDTYTISCSGSSNVTCSATSAASLTLAAGASSQVTANYSVGAAGTGSLTLTATSAATSDAGSYSIPVEIPGQRAPTTSVTAVNPGATIERSQCLTIALGPSAASECGDLRVVHDLPTTKSKNKARTPTLLYNSQLAHPYPWIGAAVTLPLVGTVPDSVTAKVTIGGVEKAKGKWQGANWSPGKTRRITLAYDALGTATGVYTYTLEVRNWYGTASNPTTATGELAIVDRSSSPFGAGWWLAGLERLDVATKTWVGGDGSVRVYTPASAMTNVWVAPSVDFPDTLKLVGTNYIRYLPDSLKVVFDQAGQHVATVNRLRDTTSFAYASGRLTTITLPPTTANKSYSFAYASGQVTVTAPQTPQQSRSAILTLSSGRVTQIKDPDNSTVKFGYDPIMTRVITSRTDRRATVTNYAYDSGRRARSGAIVLVGLPDPVTTVVAAETRGLAGSQAVDTALAHTWVDGPRTDVADTTVFRVNALGAPTVIVDPLGNTTTLARGDSRWPGLVTRLARPNGQVLGAVYDTRGRLTSSTDSSTFDPARQKYATTQYLWHTTCDAVTKITRPEGDFLQMDYDAVTCNRLWQQDGRGTVSRVNFAYYTTTGAERKLLWKVTEPLTAASVLTYDATGNLRTSTTPRGFVTTIEHDAIGRDTLVISPIDTLLPATLKQTRVVYYDLADRDTLTISAGPAMSATAVESLFVRKHYEVGGLVDTLSRWAKPNTANVGTITTKWRYDAAGRQIAEIDPADQVDSLRYDPAGNVLASYSRRALADSVTMEYDELNRVKKRTVAAVNYPSALSAIDGTQIQRPKDYAAYTVPGDVQNYFYDAVGNLVQADNADALVRRTYFPSGLLKTDSLYIRTVTGQDFNQHRYLTQFTYDLNGRRTILDFPAQFTPPRRVVGLTYAYDALFGALTTVTDPQANRYDLTYTERGELKTLTWPGQYRQELTYDADGRVAADTIRNLGGTAPPRFQLSPVRAMTYRYDARSKVLLGTDQAAYQDRLAVSYSGLGYLVQSVFEQTGKFAGSPTAKFTSTETFTYDAFGNRTYSTSAWSLGPTNLSDSRFTNRFASYQAGTGRLLTESPNAPLISYTHDLGGNIEFVQSTGGPNDERRSYYAADGRLRRIDARSAANAHVTTASTWKQTIDEYRYDALGRRVWVRSLKDCNGAQWTADPALQCQSLVRRTIWDGEQELAEIQMPGADTVSEQAYWENDTVLVTLPLVSAGGQQRDRNPLFGRVLYTHGAGLDRPLGIYRMGYVFATDADGFQVTPEFYGYFSLTPFWDRQGDAGLGAYETGEGAKCRATGSRTACVKLRWPDVYSAYDRERGFGVLRDSWHGTLLEHRSDQSGLQYKRNRYYDPAAGRFTQEDPLGLAGGINLYGFANGDPVNYSDPFGLGPCEVAIPCPPPSVIGGLLAGVARAAGQVLSGLGTAALAVVSTVLVASDEVTQKHDENTIYHRMPNDPDEVAKVMGSGKLMGGVARNVYAADIPSVKAYNGPLPAGKKGYEFTTPIPPTTAVPHPRGQVWWYPPAAKLEENGDKASIPVIVTRIAP